MSRSWEREFRLPSGYIPPDKTTITSAFQYSDFTSKNDASQLARGVNNIENMHSVKTIQEQITTCEICFLSCPLITLSLRYYLSSGEYRFY